MTTEWEFDCQLGLYQEACGKMRERDAKSRGARVNLGGCPSCKHRKAGVGSPTAQREADYASRLSAQEEAAG